MVPVNPDELRVKLKDEEEKMRRLDLIRHTLGQLREDMKSQNPSPPQVRRKVTNATNVSFDEAREASEASIIGDISAECDAEDCESAQW